jgi:hypothetical protein
MHSSLYNEPHKMGSTTTDCTSRHYDPLCNESTVRSTGTVPTEAIVLREEEFRGTEEQ